MQAQLAALQAAAASAGPLPASHAGETDTAAAAAAAGAVSSSPQHSSALQLLPPCTSEHTKQPAAGELAAHSGSSSSGSGQEVVQLHGALAAAEQHLAVLADENERLMELSNSLRAENEALKRPAQQVRHGLEE